MFLPAHQRILLVVVEYLPASCSSSSSSSSSASHPPHYLPTPQTSALCAVKKTGPGPPLLRRRGGVKEAKSAHLEPGSLTGASCVVRGAWAAAGVRVIVSGYHSWHGLLSRTEIYITPLYEYRDLPHGLT